MRYISKIGRALIIATVLFLMAGPSHAQSVSANASSTLQLTIAESISITAPPTVVFGTYSGGAATAPPFSLQLSGNLQAGRAVYLNAWLGGATNALGPIPASAIQTQFNGDGVMFCNSTDTNPAGSIGVAGAGCQDPAATSGSGFVSAWYSNPAAGAFSYSLPVVLSISGGPAVVPSATPYTGTINYQISAF